MSVRVIDFQAKVCGDTKDVTMHNFIERNLTFKLVNNPLTLMEIPDAEKTMLPTLKEMYPHWFAGNTDLRETVKRVFDQVEKAMLEAMPKDNYTDEEKAYLSGFESCLEIAQQEMNLIEEEL